MPLLIRGDGKGRYCPVIVCDHCGQEITDGRDGNYQWQVGRDGEIVNGKIYFTHKECCRSFEQANGGRRCWMFTGLECLPVFLVRNLKVDWDRAKKTARFMATLESG